MTRLNGQNQPAIRLENAGKRFYVSDRARRENFPATTRRLLTGAATHRPVWALKDVSLEIAKGEICGIIGPNGAGKSTLQLIIAGILTPTEGRVEVFGKTNPFFQLSAGLQPRLTVSENFSYCAALLGISPAKFREKFPAMLEFSGLEEYLYARYGELSSGLAARIAFSTAIHAELDIILVDEALSVGDKMFQLKCRETFINFSRQGKTLVIVSHDLDTLSGMCTSMAYLNHGRLAFHGAPAEGVRKYWSDAGEAAGKPAGQASPPYCVAPPAERAGRVKGDFISQFSSLLGIPSETMFLPAPGDLADFAGIAIGTISHGNPVKAGDEMIVPANLSPLLAEVLGRNGWVPVLIDISPETLCIDCKKLMPALSGKTRAVVASHTNGNACDLERLVRFCSENNLLLIEDSSGCLGRRCGDFHAGTAGDLGIFPFSGQPHSFGGGDFTVVSVPRAGKPITSALSACGFSWLEPDSQKLLTGLEAVKTFQSLNLARQRACEAYGKAFSGYGRWFELPDVSGCWSGAPFTYTLRVLPGAPFTRGEFMSFLNGRKIHEGKAVPDRNFLRNPRYSDIPHRVSGTLETMESFSTAGIGFKAVFEGGDGRLEQVCSAISEFLGGY